MGKRATANERAIDESIELKGEEKDEADAKRLRNEVGSDIDQELWRFFSGGYAGEAGLKSSTGGQLDRIAFGLGPATRMPDGWNSSVKYGIRGPAGRLDMGKVRMALSLMAGPYPGHKGPKPARDEERWEREWPEYFGVLRGYYTLRPRDAVDGLMSFGDYSGVVPVLPETRGMLALWRAEKLAQELEKARGATVVSQEAAVERLGLLHGRLRVTLASQDRAKHLRAYHLRKQIEAASQPLRHPDTEVTIRSKWATLTEDYALAMLRELAKIANGTLTLKNGLSRADASETRDRLIVSAESFWRAARAAYHGQRRWVDESLRTKRPKKDEKTTRRLAALLLEPEIPAETD